MNDEKLDLLTETLGWAITQPEAPALREWKQWAEKRIDQLTAESNQLHHV